jgi:hypothetical protein
VVEHLKNTITRRYQRDEFEVITVELKKTLSLFFKKVEMPLFYKNKESFGDADLLVAGLYSQQNIHKIIKDSFAPNEIFTNGNCISFDYKELQVDLIHVPEEEYDTNLMYFSYNDLGNLIGRLAHRLGLKYGQQGMWFENSFKGKNIGSVSVSTDYPKIFKFLDLDYDRYQQGFDELTDIFDFVIKSKYFNASMYQFETLNKINRDRNKKRKSYTTFLDYISKFEIKGYTFLEADETLSLVKNYFPEADIEYQIRTLEYKETKKLYLKAKFNGGELIRRFGIVNKELGGILENFKAFIGLETDRMYFNWVENHPREYLYETFKYYYDKVLQKS